MDNTKLFRNGANCPELIRVFAEQTPLVAQRGRGKP